MSKVEDALNRDLVRYCQSPHIAAAIDISSKATDSIAEEEEKRLEEISTASKWQILKRYIKDPEGRKNLNTALKGAGSIAGGSILATASADAYGAFRDSVKNKGKNRKTKVEALIDLARALTVLEDDSEETRNIAESIFGSISDAELGFLVGYRKAAKVRVSEAVTDTLRGAATRALARAQSVSASAKIAREVARADGRDAFIRGLERGTEAATYGIRRAPKLRVREEIELHPEYVDESARKVAGKLLRKDALSKVYDRLSRAAKWTHKNFGSNSAIGRGVNKSFNTKTRAFYTGAVAGAGAYAVGRKKLKRRRRSEG